MSRQSKDRHVWGEICPVYVPALNGTTIKTGDLVECGSGVDVKTLAVATTIAGFCGVAMQDIVVAVAADGDAIRVATEGVFEFDCATAALAVGQEVMMSTDAQTVIATATYGEVTDAIGRVWKTKAAGVLKVWVKIDTRIKWGTTPTDA